MVRPINSNIDFTYTTHCGICECFLTADEVCQVDDARVSEVCADCLELLDVCLGCGCHITSEDVEEPDRYCEDCY
jgi:hypothetical protein